MPKEKTDIINLGCRLNIFEGEVIRSLTSQNKLLIIRLFYDLNASNETYASLAFISGVGHKNSQIGWKFTVF